MKLFLPALARFACRMACPSVQSIGLERDHEVGPLLVPDVPKGGLSAMDIEIIYVYMCLYI